MLWPHTVVTTEWKDRTPLPAALINSSTLDFADDTAYEAMMEHCRSALQVVTQPGRRHDAFTHAEYESMRE